MAKKVVTLTEYIDDLDGKAIDEGMVQSIEFSYAGGSYRLDLRPTNAEKLDKLLKPYIDAAEKIGGRTRRPKVGGGASGAHSPKRRESAKEDLRAIRDWARKQGITVSQRGRISQSVRQKYLEAHKA